MKIKGAELKAWMDEAWPGDDWFWDHDIFDDEPAPLETYDTDDLGDLQFQGDDPDQDPTRGAGYDLARLIRQWRKTTGKTVVSVAVPPGKLRDLRVAVKALGGTVL